MHSNFAFILYIKIKSQPKPSSGYYILKLTTKYFQKGVWFQKIHMHFDFFQGWASFLYHGVVKRGKKIQQWYEISEDHWSEIVYNYHFKGRTPVLLREHTYAVHFLTIIMRVNDVPQFLNFHLFALICSAAGGQWDSPFEGRHGGSSPTPASPGSHAFLSLLKHIKSMQGKF